MQIKATPKFKTKLRTMFYVANVKAVEGEIARQIETKEAVQMGYEIWTVFIFGIPATVILWNEALVSLRYVG